MIKAKFDNMTARLAALATVGAMLGTSSMAQATGGGAGAGQGFSGATSNIQASTADLPGLISTVAYIGGAGLGVAGVLKMKQHVDNPGQTPLKDGLVRLGAGGGLLALPFVLESMTTTIGDQQGFTARTIPSVGAGGTAAP
jgi:hypothetical protein